ncbi:MAG: mannose-1-phosphate guanylyltransferase/mannose-6-phosphate isomerase [Pseudomonadota bacterium]
MTTTITPVILAGGSGTRLWPLSRADRPKQFQKFLGERSLLQDTLARIEAYDGYSAPIVLTNEDYRFVVAEQAQEIGVTLASIVLEPMMRNTAPALTAVAHMAAKADEDAILHVMPSDHAIETDDSYWSAIRAAATAAASGRLATFGIEPAHPATGYGYIKAGAALSEGAFEIESFIEKPDRARAEAMIEAGGHMWNAGMFMFRARDFLSEAASLAPDMAAAATAAVDAARADLDFMRLDAVAFSKSPEISVDYAVFEKTKLAAVVPLSVKWSDLGAWNAVWAASPHDAAGNASRGPATVMDATNCFVASEGPHVAVQNVDDVAVVATPDAVWVGRLSEAETVKSLVGALKESPDTADLATTHRTSYRPWGGYTSAMTGDRFQVKRLFVNPGAKLSLQKHHHRAEHWIVVSGTAEVTVDDKVFILSENQSTYIPLGAVHRLANPGKILLELIEVQSGSYLGEDDIIRLEDEFGRN